MAKKPKDNYTTYGVARAKRKIDTTPRKTTVFRNADGSMTVSLDRAGATNLPKVTREDRVPDMLRTRNSEDVDGNFVNSFFKDATDFLATSQKDYEGMGYGSNAKSVSLNKRAQKNALDYRAKKIKQWAISSNGVLTDEQRKQILDGLNAWDTEGANVASVFKDAGGVQGKWTKDDYESYERSKKLSSADPEKERGDARKLRIRTETAQRYDKILRDYEDAGIGMENEKYRIAYNAYKQELGGYRTYEELAAAADAKEKDSREIDEVIAYNKRRQKLGKVDVSEVRAETEGLKGRVEEGKELLTRMRQIENNPAVYDPSVVPEWREANSRLGVILGEYKTVDEMEAAYHQRSQYLMEAEDVQLQENALKDPEFEKYARVGASIDNPEYQAGNLNVGNKVVYTRENYQKHKEYQARVEADGGVAPEAVNMDERWLYLTEDEVDTYNYYLAKYGEAKADRYLESMAQELERRKASADFQNYDDRRGLQLLYGVGQGFRQFARGIGTIFEPYTDRPIQKSDEILAGMIREDMGKTGVENTLWQLAYDVATNTANMAPSMALSAIPVVGQGLGVAALGVSAGGNAYRQGRLEGMTDEQARGYGLLSGASETLLQYLLGGITKLGGKVSGQAVSKLMSKVNSGLGRTAIQLGGQMLSEFTEEGLQELLDPVFRHVATGEEIKVDFEQAIYAGVLGAITAGLFEGKGAIKTNVQLYRTGAAVQELGRAQELAEIGRGFAKGTETRRLADMVTADTDAYTMGRLLQATQTELTAQNQRDIVQTLKENGVRESDARTLTNAVMAISNGAEFSEEQIMALAKNDVLAGALKTALISPDSAVQKRTSALMDLAYEVANGPKARQSTEEPKSAMDIALEMAREEIAQERKAVEPKGASVAAEPIANVNAGVAPTAQLDVKARQALEENASDNVDRRTYTNSFISIYSAARSGASLKEAIAATLDAGKLSNEQINAAYDAGHDVYIKGIQSKAGAKKASRAETKRAAKPGVSREFEVAKNEDRKTRNNRNLSLIALDRVAKKTGKVVHVVNSINQVPGIDGKASAKVYRRLGKEGDANAYYNTQTGEYYIALDAIDKSYLLVAVHESVHDGAQNNAKGFEKLARITKEVLLDNGFTEEQLGEVEDIEEFMCNTVPVILTDRATIDEFVSRIIGADVSTRTAFEKFIDRIYEVIMDAYNALKENSQWTQMEAIKDDLDGIRKIRDAYFEMLEGTVGQQNRTQDGKASVKTLSDGRQYVEADRDGIFGKNPAEWPQQIENYINNEIRNGRDVTVYAIDGDALTITADTAGKAKFRNEIKMKDGSTRLMTDEEYAVKLRAEAHVDELAQVSRRGKKDVPDYKNHQFAVDGFNYRTAYYMDETGYYRVTMSVGKNGKINTIYNVGKLTEAEFPKISGSKAKRFSASKGSIRTTSQESQEEFSEDVEIIEDGKASMVGPRAKRNDPFGKILPKMKAGTGWFIGKDGMPRFEISDKDARVREGRVSKVLNDVAVESKRNKTSVIKTMKLSEVLVHDALYGLYPQLKDVTVKIINNNDVIARVNANNEIEVGQKAREHTDKLKGVILHETQHLIQRIEGFAIGGNARVGWMLALLKASEKVDARIFAKLKTERERSAYLQQIAVRQGETMHDVAKREYLDLYGEIEARQTDGRREFSQEEFEKNKYENEGTVIYGHGEIERAFEALLRGDRNAYADYRRYVKQRGKNIFRVGGGSPRLGRRGVRASDGRGDDSFSANYDEQGHSGERTQIDSDYIAAVAHGDMDTAQKMVEEAARTAGYTIKGNHGTVSYFNIFDRSYGNPEGDWGKGFYFTNNEEDVNTNYASTEGADLTQKIELLAERLEWEDGYEDMDYEERLEEARKQLIKSDPRVIKAYLSMENPVVIGGLKETTFDYEEAYDEELDEYEEPEGLFVDFMQALEFVLEDYDARGLDLSPLWVAAMENEGLDASDLESIAKEVLAYAEDDEGNLVSNEIIRSAFEEMGFDGIIDNTVAKKFGTESDRINVMAGVTEDTTHYIVFKSSQIKQADPVTYDDEGNVIPLSERFNPQNKDIRFSLKTKPATDAFYSQMGKVVDGIKTEKVSANGVIPYLKGKGVKNEEIKWSGIEAFLEGKKSVTKQELQEFVAGSMVQIEEITIDRKGTKDLARWGSYTLPGGNNYREIVFRMPDSTYTNDAMHTHWGEDFGIEGVLAHARVQDFEQEFNGWKTLFIEEIQSDWHNEGQNKGYARRLSPQQEARRLQIDKRVEKLLTERNTVSKELRSIPREEISDRKAALNIKYLKLSEQIDGLRDELFEIYGTKRMGLLDLPHMSGVPDAPFQNYHEFVLKRLIREAAENGYDSIGWTTAKTQSQRWSDKYAEGYRIEYDQDIPKFLNKYGKKWGAKVEKSTLPNGTEIWSMDITDAMRESVTTEGQPLFSKKAETAVYRTDAQILKTAKGSTEAEKNALARYQVNRNSLAQRTNNLLSVTERMETAKGKERSELAAQKRRLENDVELFEKRMVKLREEQTLQDILTRERVKEWGDLISEYKTIPKGEQVNGTPKNRDIDVPRWTSKEDKVRRFVRTIVEAKTIPDEMIDPIRAAVIEGGMSYVPESNANLLEVAKERTESENLPSAWETWDDVVSGRGKLDASAIALGEMLLKRAAENGDAKQVVVLAAELAEIGTRAGQTIQAFKLLKRAGAAGRIVYLDRTVAAINRAFAKRGAKFAAQHHVSVDEALINKLLTAKNEAERDAVMAEIYQDIANKMPNTWIDKWNAWRYLAMLGNPLTHVRNLAGNAMSVPAIVAKNVIAAGIEKAMIRAGATFTPTKAVVVSKEYMRFAKADFDDVRNELTGNGKYNDMDEIRARQRVFKFAPVEAVRRFNFDLLEKEDGIFLKFHYQNALAQYMQANHIDLAMMSDETLGKARAHAMLEAQKATYRNASTLATILQEAGQKSPTLKFAIDSVMPFKKTPINILKMGINYSPIGLITTMAKGLNSVVKMKKDGAGTMTMSEFIDGMAAGTVGTAVVGLGYFMAAMGWLVGGLGDDDEDRLMKLAGEQGYAIKIGNSTYTISWAAPISLPLLVGAALYDATQEKQEWDTASVFQAMSLVSEPMINLSMLDGLNSMLEAAAYASDDDRISKVAEAAIESYASQPFPTALAQMARIIDPNQRSVYVDKNSKTPPMLQRIGQNIAKKIPGLSYLLMPSYNEWGEKRGDGDFERILENTISPGYHSKVQYNEVETELKRLMEATGEGSIVPDMPPKKIGDKDLTREEYEAYVALRGQPSLKLLNELIQTEEYKAMTDDEKVRAIEYAHQYVNDLAKYAIYPTDAEGNEINVPPDWVMEVQTATTDAENPVSAGVGIAKHTQEQYIEKKKSDAAWAAFDDGDVDSAVEYIETQREAGKEDSQIWQSVRGRYQDEYVELWNAGREDEANALAMKIKALGLRGKKGPYATDKKFKEWRTPKKDEKE